MTQKQIALCGCVMRVLAGSSHAYIGPGVGVTMIGWLVGAGVLMGAAFWAVISFPLRMIFKKKKRQDAVQQDESDERAN